MTITAAPAEDTAVPGDIQTRARRSTHVDEVVTIRRPEASALAAAENQRFVDVVCAFDPGDWTKPTDCPAWDVRALVSHVLGEMEAFSSLPEFVHQMRAGKKAAGDRPFIDGMTEVQVRERAHLDGAQLVEKVILMGPRCARSRGRVPALLRRMPMKQELADGTRETWRLGYLLDVILTRDTWIHRVDLARATGREIVLTAAHDGRIVADVVAEWARRHGRPFTLHLEGVAGASYTTGDGGERITIDAVEFCRTVSGRATGAGLLTQQVPF